MKDFKISIIFLLLLGFFVACDKEDGSEEAIETEKACITFISPYSGLGDDGYYDLTFSAVTDFCAAHDVALSLKYPQSSADVTEIINNWARYSGKSSQLLVLSNSDFEQPLKDANVSLDDKQHILLFESVNCDLGENVCTFRLQRYGVSFLAGLMAAPMEQAVVVMARPHDPALTAACAGFNDGYSTGGNRAKSIFLAEDYSGFCNPTKGYTVAAENSSAFIYPLAGGSNLGIYKFSRDHYDYTQIVAGMDVDCLDFFGATPFSVLVHIDNVLKTYLDGWLSGSLPASGISYGLASGEVDILVHDVNLPPIGETFNNYAYWRSVYDTNKELAITKEGEYEKDN